MYAMILRGFFFINLRFLLLFVSFLDIPLAVQRFPFFPHAKITYLIYATLRPFTIEELPDLGVTEKENRKEAICLPNM